LTFKALSFIAYVIVSLASAIYIVNYAIVGLYVFDLGLDGDTSLKFLPEKNLLKLVLQIFQSSSALIRCVGL